MLLRLLLPWRFMFQLVDHHKLKTTMTLTLRFIYFAEAFSARLTKTDRAAGAGRRDHDAASSQRFIVPTKRNADTKGQSGTASALLTSILRWPRVSIVVRPPVYGALLLLRPTGSCAKKKERKKTPLRRSMRINNNNRILSGQLCLYTRALTYRFHIHWINSATAS